MACGCFGNVHVNPWITIFAVDLPAVIALILCRPKQPGQWFTPWPSWARLALYAAFCLIILIPSTIILAQREPALVTQEYEVLMPSEWAGAELQVLDRIDVAEIIGYGDWLLFLYHHDCPTCREAMPAYQEFARQLGNGGGFLRTAFIAIPPVDPEMIEPDSAWVLGELDAKKRWFAQTPVIAIISDGIVRFAVDGEAPPTDELLNTYLTLLDEE